jgi:hypothetical protein
MRSYAVVSLLILNTCASPRTSGAPVPGPQVVQPSVDSTLAETRCSIQVAPGRIQSFHRRRTEQADSTATDSLRRHARIRLIPVQDSVLTLTFETIRDSTDTTSVVAMSRLTMNPNGRSSALTASTEECVMRPPEVSPLLVRQLVYPADPRLFAVKGRFIDSLTYSSCIQGVRVQSDIELEWTRSPVQPDNVLLYLELRLNGRLQADSTRSFPMNLSGTLKGTSMLTFNREGLYLHELRSRITSDLEAISGTSRRQRFAQVVAYHVLRDTSGSIH